MKEALYLITGFLSIIAMIKMKDTKKKLTYGDLLLALSLCWAGHLILLMVSFFTLTYKLSEYPIFKEKK